MLPLTSLAVVDNTAQNPIVEVGGRLLLRDKAPVLRVSYIVLACGAARLT